MFILADSYGDGGASATVSVNGEEIGMVYTNTGDALSNYSGLYESQFGFDVTDATTDDGGDDGAGDDGAGDDGGEEPATYSDLIFQFQD